MTLRMRRLQIPRSAITAAAALGVLAAAPAHAEAFDVAALVTNDQAAHHASITDSNLVNAWGISYGPTGPFWVSDNGAGVSTLYRVSPATNAVVKASLTVAIPGEGSVTGQVFNSTSAFNADSFLFVSEDGTVAGWRASLGTIAETLKSGSADNVYKGTTIGTVGTHTYLYSANFRNGTVDVMKGDVGAPTLAGTFTDPSLPAGYAPFNLQKIGDTLYVTYALQNGTKHDDVAGAGHGFVDAYDLNGNLLRRVASGGALDSPWGITVAPVTFGDLAGDLLIGNFGDGQISAFAPGTDAYVGQLLGRDGSPLSLDGLWGITPGNGGLAGSPSYLYFSAGPDGESNGLFGVILPVPEPASLALLALGLGAAALTRRKAGLRPLCGSGRTGS